MERLNFHVIFRFSWWEWLFFAAISAIGLEYLYGFQFYSNYMLLSVPAVFMAHYSSRLRGDVADRHAVLLQRLRRRRYRDSILFIVYTSALLAYLAMSFLTLLTILIFVLPVIFGPSIYLYTYTVKALGLSFFGYYFMGVLFIVLHAIGFFLFVSGMSLIFPKSVANAIAGALIKMKNYVAKSIYYCLELHDRVVKRLIRQISDLNSLSI